MQSSPARLMAVRKKGEASFSRNGPFLVGIVSQGDSLRGLRFELVEATGGSGPADSRR